MVDDNWRARAESIGVTYTPTTVPLCKCRDCSLFNANEHTPRVGFGLCAVNGGQWANKRRRCKAFVAIEKKTQHGGN